MSCPHCLCLSCQAERQRWTNPYESPKYMNSWHCVHCGAWTRFGELHVCMIGHFPAIPPLFTANAE